MEIIGQTVCGEKGAMLHISKLYAQNGVPFETSIMEAAKSGVQLSFIHELNLALWYGWTTEKFMSVLGESLDMVYDRSTRREIEAKLNEYISKRNEATMFNIKVLSETKQFNDYKA